MLCYACKEKTDITEKVEQSRVEEAASGAELWSLKFEFVKGQYNFET